MMLWTFGACGRMNKKSRHGLLCLSPQSLVDRIGREGLGCVALLKELWDRAGWGSRLRRFPVISCAPSTPCLQV